MRRGYAFVLLQLLVLGNGNLFESAGAEESACQGNLSPPPSFFSKCPIKYQGHTFSSQDSRFFCLRLWSVSLHHGGFYPAACRAELLYTLSRTTAALSTHTTTITHPNNPQYPSGLDCQDCKGQHCARECRGEACGKSCVGLACAAQCTGELCGAGCIGEAW